ncbi:TonB-dependent receptor [Mucilaginibacter sp. BT774]|uniref:TonB-dependent receptor domain-containing protein n=1 Tax=Mucilaginibacter sp. BT774 TaxID=3062276 RepID=UPI0026748FEC|nr:TonB-dependent receptor [Mucilaginibacter sp. BT774]MDO3625663.1 TonB-dependent receptor plug domain-containing protein [Mucilaginibacter sp. BT774]
MAQNVIVTGRVADSHDGTPLRGVCVLAKGTSANTVTDNNGAFKLSVPSSVTTLVIGNIDYIQKEIAITGSPLSVSLESSSAWPTRAAGISFGYGLQRKRDVSSATAALTTENFNQGAIFNPVDQLAGKISGLTITEPGGDPNQTAEVHLRGQSVLMGSLSPLFVVDGVILDDAAQFQSIPPDDIDSYEVLKDASATAIYGVRGANGVIIVTTKKGVAGRTAISYNGLLGASVQSKYYDLLTPNEYRAAIASLNPATYDKGGNTDWQKAVSRTAYQQRHYVSISQGTSTFNYLASADYQNQQGIILNSGKEQMGLHLNAELKTLANKLDIKAGIHNITTTRKFTDYSVFSFIPNSPPTYPVKNSDGSYFTYTDFDEANPVEHFTQEVLGDKEYLTLINASADYSIIKDLKIGILGSFDRNKIESSGFIPTFPLEGNTNQTANGEGNTHSYRGNIHIAYHKIFGKSVLDLLGAYEYYDYSNNIGYTSTSSNYSSKEKYKLKSFIARAAYSYDERFYATASLRKENQIIIVGNNNPNEYFPAFSLAYRFKEDLLANVDWISDMKLKGGYGITATATSQFVLPFIESGEKQGRNVGLDFALFNGRLSGDLNYFNDETKNLLFNYPVPTPPFITPDMLINSGTMTNKGFEVHLSGKIISGHKLNWTANGQITFITTRINDLTAQFTANGQTYTLHPPQVPLGYAQGRGLSSNPIEFVKEGFSPYVFYLPHYTGVDASGNQTFDGQTIAQNPNPAGHYIDPAPKFNYGFSNSFDYGNWNLNFTLRGVDGQKVFNNTLLDLQTVTRLPGNNVTKEALTDGVKDFPVASDRWLEGASFLRMDNITLAYSFRNVSFANALRVFVSGNNLFVITGYKGLDPEVKTENASGGNILFGGNLNGSTNQAYIDNNYGGQAYYPRVRTLSLGVNVTLK